MYRKLTSIPLALALTLSVGLAAWHSTAHACGGGFGQGLSIDPSQKIVVAYKGGVETYVFSPHFCGTAASFGLILPVPGTLTENPSLADAKLFDQLEELTKPTIVKKKACEPGRGGGRDAGAWGGDASVPPVQIVDRGKVGIFDWVLLKADTAKAFTDWLDANKFPHDANAADAFSHYVTEGWHFVAFKVTADDKAPPAGSKLCGDLGPLSLSFNAPKLTIPARIASAAASSFSYGWRVFALTDAEQTTTNQQVDNQLRYSGSLTAAELTKYPEIAKLAAAGDRLTKLDLGFYGGNLKTDIVLEKASQQKDFRQEVVQTEYINCDDGGNPTTDGGKQPPNTGDDSGCSVAGTGDASLALLGLALLGCLGFARRRRRQRA